jgi:hypothetical protein
MRKSGHHLVLWGPESRFTIIAATAATRLPPGDRCGNLQITGGFSQHPAQPKILQADMESLFSSPGSIPGSSADPGPRVKVMRWPGSLRLGQTTLLEGKAIQISSGGVGLLLGRSVRDGEVGLVRVNAFINGAPLNLQARASVVCCACVGMEGFRISLRFLELDGEAQDALDKLLHAR